MPVRWNAFPARAVALAAAHPKAAVASVVGRRAVAVAAAAVTAATVTAAVTAVAVKAAAVRAAVRAAEDVACWPLIAMVRCGRLASTDVCPDSQSDPPVSTLAV